MKTKVFGTAVFAALAAGVVVALRRFGPELAERGMNKCHEMMGHLAEEYPPKQAVQEEGREDSEAGNVGEDQKRQALAATT